MSGHHNYFNAGNDFRVTVQKIPLTRLLHGHEIIWEIAGAIAFGWRAGVLKFLALHKVSRVWKRRHGNTVHDARVPSAMIEMQMGIDDDVDLFGLDPCCREAIQ